MLSTASGRHCPPWKHLALLCALVLACCAGFGQTITVSFRNTPLETALHEVEKRSPYRFVYTNEDLEGAKPVTLDLKDAPLAQLLQRLFEDQPLTYTVDEHFVILRIKSKAPPGTVLIGRVLNEKREPLAGASVSVRGTDQATPTDNDGNFMLRGINRQAVLIVTNVGYQPRAVATAGRTQIEITLPLAVNSLDETIVIAYGTTTLRLNTGNVTRVGADAIARQPVTNPLATLAGRVPGLNITQTSGVPGGSFRVEVRGRSAIDPNLSRNEPLFVIDGVPFEQGNGGANQLATAANNPNAISQDGLSPLNAINPADIESIEVLKDADATAIYGSRGANGVILITTKRGRPGKTRFDLNLYSGRSRVTRTQPLLNTQQFVAMRREAFANDGIVPTAANAPELFLWDTTRYTDLQKLLIGGTARTLDAELSISGGNLLTQFLVSGGYHRETTIFPNDFPNTRGSVHIGLAHNTADKRFGLQFSGYYTYNGNRMPAFDPTPYINLPPNILLTDSAGRLNWQEKGVTFSNLNNFSNPLAQMLVRYASGGTNLGGDLKLTGRLTRNLLLRLNAGYNYFALTENLVYPTAAIDPTFPFPSFSDFASSSASNWLLEPQAEWTQNIGRGKLTALAGATWQSRNQTNLSIEGSNYTSDLFIRSLRAAGMLTASNNVVDYRYNAFFGRVNYNWNDRYVVNASARRDGSSRFGPGRQFATFSAVGAAWIFSSTKLVSKRLSVLSFGKLRGSYGSAGNDQIGNYKYLDLWTPASVTYQGQSGLIPSGLFNPDYRWEVTRKLELAIDLGFWKNRLLVSADWYRHRARNQLVTYPVAAQTGFVNVTKNLDALVENRGWEFSLSSRNIDRPRVSWSTSFNLTMPQNRLLSFPDLARSSYSTTYVVGEPLNLIYKYRFLGVDPQTGLYAFDDVNKDSKYTSADYVAQGTTDPKFYGGLGNTVRYGGWSLDVLFEFRKQVGRNYLDRLAAFPPGTLYNQPTLVLARWRQPGDVTDIQRFTYNTATAAASASLTRLAQSGAVFSDASYVRLKNVSLSYELPAGWLRRVHLERCRLYVQGQNLATITGYKGSDPETQNFLRVPPLRTIVGGLQLNF